MTTGYINLPVSTGGGGGVNGHVIEDEGTPLTQRANLNFVGPRFSATDDAGNDASVVTYTDVGAVTTPGAFSIDLDFGNNDFFTKTIAGNETFTISNVPSSGVFHFLIEITLTSGSITWWSGIEWPGGAAPSGLATGVKHVFGFYTRDGGTSYVGFILEDIS